MLSLIYPTSSGGYFLHVSWVKFCTQLSSLWLFYVFRIYHISCFIRRNGIKWRIKLCSSPPCVTSPFSVQIFCLSLNSQVRPNFAQVCLSIYGSTALVDLYHFFSFSICTQSVELIWRVISPSQGRHLQREKHKQNKRTQTSIPRVDSNSRSQFSSGCKRFMPYIARPLWSAFQISTKKL
jgi:hypothetical protein